MTRKELSRRALYERDKVVMFLMDNLTKDYPTAVKSLHKQGYNIGVQGDYFCVITDNTQLRLTKSPKGYVEVEDSQINVFGLGTFNFWQLVDMRGKAHTFTIKLTDTDNEEVMFCEVETTRTIKQFEKIYKQIRNKWYMEDQPDCLWDYLVDKLYEQGFALYRLLEDIGLDF